MFRLLASDRLATFLSTLWPGKTSGVGEAGKVGDTASRSSSASAAVHDAAHLTYRSDIDGLRAIAVLSVVMFHAFPTLLPGGFVGVDVFFVISGYLIGSILIKEFATQDFSVARFYARRIRRIFPALILVLCAVYGVGWFNLLDDEFMQLGKHIAAGAGFVSNLALWQEAGYFDASAATKPLLHLWSLGVEEQFYLVWPLVLYVCMRMRWSVLAATLTIGIASFVLNLMTIGHDPTGDFYSPLTRFWELMIGSLLAYRHTSVLQHANTNTNTNANLSGTSHDNGTQRVAHFKSALGIALLIAATVWVRGQDAFPGWRALLPTVGAYLVIDSGRHAFFNARVLSLRPVVWIGLISFPLYLWHWPLLSYALILEGQTPAWPVRLGAVAVALVLAWLTYRFVEQPIRARSTPIIHRLKIGVLSVLMLAIAFVGYDTYARHGLSFRLTKIVTQFANVDRDIGGPWRSDTCFLGGEDGPEKFSAACTDPGTAPLVFLWGDSHAAALSPGLRDVIQQRKDLRFAQYTASGCLPALGKDEPSSHCAAVQTRAFEFLTHDKPHLVIVSADWSKDKFDTLTDTVGAIRKAGVADRDIVVVGPVPQWPEFLPKVYWRYWRKNHQVLPVYTRFGLDPTTEGVDQYGESIAAKLGVRYVSPYRAMCNADGCRTRTGPGKGEITTWDDAHLTPPESVTLMRELAPQWIPPVSP